jgi:alkylhydroperoxidase family enzyme
VPAGPWPVLEAAAGGPDAASGVSGEVWAYAAEYYDEEQLTALVILISFMNMVNRLNIITRQPAGNYEAGQFH